MAKRKTVTQFGADASDFKSAVTDMTKALDGLNRQLIDNQKAQKASNTVINEAEKELKSIAAEAKANGTLTKEQKDRIKELNAVIDEEKDKLAHLRSEQTELKGAIKATVQEMNKAKDSTVDYKKANEDLLKSLGEVKNAGKQVAADITAIGAAAVGAAAGLFEFVHSAAQWADDMNTLSKVTGIGTDELQKFSYATNLIDVDISTMTGSLTKMTRTMNDARDGSGNAAEAYKTLGISVTDSEGALRDRLEVYYEVIDALGKVENETERDALAMQLFGKSAEQLNPLIKGGAENLKKLGKEAEEAGLILDQKTLDSLNGFNDEIDKLKAQGAQISRIVAAQAKPAVEDIVDLGNDLLKIVKEMADSGEIKGFADEAGKAIKAGVEGLKTALEWINKNKEAIAGITAAVIAFKLAFDIGTLISSLVTALGALKTVLDAAKLSQLELNAAMSANPIGLVLGLLSALTVGIIAYNAAAQTAAKSTDEYAQSTSRAEKAVKNFDDAVQARQDKYAETIGSMEAETALIDKLSKRYDELRQKTQLTTAEKAELNVISGELAEKIGVEADGLKDELGRYKDLNSEIETHIENLKAETELQAKAELYKDTVKERVKAEIELGKAEKARNEYYEAHKDRIDNAFKDGYRIDSNTEYQEYIRLSGAVDELNRRVEESAEVENAAADAYEQASKMKSTATSASNDYAESSKKEAEAIYEVADASKLAEEALTRENSNLLKNQENITLTREKLKAAEKDLSKLLADKENLDLKTVYEAQQRVNALEDEIAEYLTDQAKIRNNISTLKKELKDLQNTTEAAAGDYLADLKSISDMMEKINSETADGGKLTLGTLQSIIKKYPEMTDVCDDYINGLKTEADIISGLKKYYDADVDAYNSAVGLKKLATDSMSADCSQAVKKLVDKYSEQYGIDIRNFSSATAAKAAAHQGLINKMIAAEAEYRKVSDENNYVTFNNAYGRQVYAKNADGTLREVTGAELAQIDAVRQAYFQAQKNVREFDGEAFAKTLANQLTSLYGGTSADALGRLSGSGGSTGGSSGGSTTNKSNWTMNALGVYASGSSAVAAELQWLDRVSALGKINEEQQKKYLQGWLNSTKMTADERYEIEKRLYDLNKKLSEKAQQERETAADAEQKKRLERLEYAKEAYNKLVKGQIEVYENRNEAIEKNLDKQIKVLDEKLNLRKQQQEDENRLDEINQVNLRLRYANLTDTEKNSLNKKLSELRQEQADADFERNIEKQKKDLQEQANAQMAKNTDAMERLSQAMEDAAYYFAKLTGTQTVSQVVNNSTKNQTTNYIRAGLTEAEAAKLLKTIY